MCWQSHTPSFVLLKRNLVHQMCRLLLRAKGLENKANRMDSKARCGMSYASKIDAICLRAMLKQFRFELMDEMHMHWPLDQWEWILESFEYRYVGGKPKYACCGTSFVIDPDIVKWCHTDCMLMLTFTRPIDEDESNVFRYQNPVHLLRKRSAP